MGAALPHPTLPFLETCRAALLHLWLNREAWLRLALVPAMLSFALGVTLEAIDNRDLALFVSVADILPLTLFSVSWHRLMLLGPQGAPGGLGATWEARHTRFLGRTLVLGLGLGLIAVAPALILVEVMGSIPVIAMPLLGMIVVMLLVATRLSLVFPAIAIDRGYGFFDSWRDTAGHGFRIVGLILATQAPFWLAMVALRLIATDTGLAQAAPYTLALVQEAGNYLAAAGGVAVLSLAFRALATPTGKLV
jgi:hypothetical protein